MQRVVGYARVSSSGQKDQPLDRQIARLRGAGATEIISEVESGRKDDRNKYLKLLQRVKDGLCEGAIFTRMDRLGRNASEILNSVEVYKKAGAFIVVLDQQIDTRDPRQDYFLIVLYAGLAQQESERLSERVRHGWNYTRKIKKAVNPPFGYTVVANKYVFDKEPFLCLLEDSPVEVPLKLRPQGWEPPHDHQGKKWVEGKTSEFPGRSRYQIAVDAIEIFRNKRSLNSTVREINRKYLYSNWQRGRSSKLLNDTRKDYEIVEDSGRRNKRSRNNLGWSVPGLKLWLLNPVLQGHTRYTVREKGEEPAELFYPNTHEDILVDLELLSKIHFYLENNERIANYNPEKQKDRHLFSGTIKCAACQCSCYLVRKDDGENRNAKYFQCHNARMKRCNNNRYIRIADIEEELVKILIEAQKEGIEKIRRRQEEASETLKKVEEELAYYENAPNPNNPTIKTIKEECQKRIAALTDLIESKAPNPLSPEKLDLFVEFTQKTPPVEKYYERSSEMAAMFKELVQFIWVNDGKIVKITSR